MFEGWGALLWLAEQMWKGPEVVGDFLARPIPESQGVGRRPVALFLVVVRVWGCVRQVWLRQWQAQHVQDAVVNERMGWCSAPTSSGSARRCS